MEGIPDVKKEQRRGTDWCLISLEKGETMTQPDYIVRTAKETNGKKKWVDIGIAYAIKRGSITVYLSALPLTDTLFLLPVKR